MTLTDGVCCIEFFSPTNGSTSDMKETVAYSIADRRPPSQALPLKVLVAEDDPATRGMVSQYLRKKGLEVIEATDGDEALEAIAGEPVGIAIIDWVMPGVNGIEVCKKIRERKKSNYIYIIMLTAKESNEDILAGFEAGVDEYVYKPTNLKELYARVKVGIRIVHLEQSLKKQQEQLSELIKIKNKFISIAAHDLRNPVISIRGFSELLLKGKNNLTEEQREFISIIHTTSENMLALLNDLLDLSQIEMGHLEIKPQPDSLKDLIEERLRMHRVQAEQKRISINTRLNDIPSFPFDRQRISQAVDNLVTNAIKFSPPGAKIYMVLEEQNGNAFFCVRDEGPGIPPEEQPLLFSEFQRLSIRPTGGESSTGLGLAITKKIIDAHGGKIDYESRVGRGSSFYFLLPMEPDKEIQSEHRKKTI